MPRSAQLVLLAVLLLLLGLTVAVGAQTTGSIRGEIKDQEGDALPGVTVTATSDSRGVSRTTLSGAGGRFVLSSMPIDSYTISTTLEGFQDQRIENVRVGIASTVKLEIEMALVTVEEVVTVTSTPILDVTSSSVGTNFTAEFIEDLPTDRNFWDMLAVSPGISAQSEGSTRMSAFGSSTSSNSWSIDGLDTTSSDTGNAWWYINPDTIEEVQVLGIGAPAAVRQHVGRGVQRRHQVGHQRVQGHVELVRADRRVDRGER